MKMTINLPAKSAFGANTETVVVKPIGDQHFVVLNVPFVAKGISCGDTVMADDERGLLTFRRVISRGGHSTYRVFVKTGYRLAEVERLKEDLKTGDCEIEVATEQLFAIDVLPEADIHRVYALLDEAEQSGVISDFEEGHCGHEIGERSPFWSDQEQ